DEVRKSFPARADAGRRRTTRAQPLRRGGPATGARLRRVGRSFQLDDVALGIGDVDRRPFALRAVARFHTTVLDAVAVEMREDRVRVEGIDGHAVVIEVASLATGRGAAHAP